MRKKYILACLDCGDEYSAKDEFFPCPQCGGTGDLSVSNYESSSFNYENEFDDYHKDIDVEHLVYDPDVYD